MNAANLDVELWQKLRAVTWPERSKRRPLQRLRAFLIHRLGGVCLEAPDIASVAASMPMSADSEATVAYRALRRALAGTYSLYAEACKANGVYACPQATYTRRLNDFPPLAQLKREREAAQSALDIRPGTVGYGRNGGSPA